MMIKLNELLSGWPVGLKSAEDFVEILSDADLIVFEVIQPEIVAAVGLGQERKEIADPHPNARLLAVSRLVLEGARKHTQVSWHAVLLGLSWRYVIDRQAGSTGFGKSASLFSVI
jgi:hypothetical protein